jgi:hypothetical protein
MNEMIDALTRGIGVDLYRPMRISFYNKKRFLEKNEKYLKSPDNIKQFLIDVVALSIFNHQVIIPLSGATNFLTGTKSYRVTKVRMGTYYLDKDFSITTNKIINQFYSITNSYGLKMDSLYVSSIDEFVDLWLEDVENRDI